jgi:hypothetical protein
MFRSLKRALSSRRSMGVTKRKPFRPALEELHCRIVPSTTTNGIQNWGAQFFAPYVNVEQPQGGGTPLDFVQAAQAGNVKFLALGFVDVDSNGNASWQGDTGAELNNSQLDQYLCTQTDNLRNQVGGDVMVSFGGEDDSAGQSTEFAVHVASTMGTGTDALNQLVSDYQQVIDEYHLTHIDFDIEGAAATDTASINLRSQALAQLQKNNQGLQVSFTLGGDAPQDANLQFGMTGDAQTVVNSALDAGVNIAGVNLMTMDFSNWVNYYDDTPANQQLYGQQLNPGGFGWAGNDAAEQGIQNVADVIKLNANAEFTQLQQMLTNHGVAMTNAQIWQMVGITPEIGRNFTNESTQGQAGNSNVIFSLADAQTVESFAQPLGIGRISMWSLQRDQNGNPDDATHYETNSSLVQTPYAFSQIFSQIDSPPPPVSPPPPASPPPPVSPPPPAPSQPPTVVTPAQAAASDVTTTSTNLSVLGGDAAGEASLTYTWSTVGTPPGAVTFSDNGSNTAKNTTVSFSAAGMYTFQVTITDPGGLSTTSSVSVVVSQVFKSIAITPAPLSIATGAKQQLTATALDQFGSAMASQPGFVWSARGGGTISKAGRYTAPATSGNAVIVARADGLAGSTTIKTVPPITAHAIFADTNDWGTGFTGSITLKNTGTTSANRWTLQFDFTGNITAIWDAVILSHVGNHYVIGGASWDLRLPARQGITFGFNADWATPPSDPVNYIINGTRVAVR